MSMYTCNVLCGAGVQHAHTGQHTARNTLAQSCPPCLEPELARIGTDRTRLPSQIAGFERQTTQRSSATAEEEAAMGSVSILRAELAATEALLQRAQASGPP